MARAQKAKKGSLLANFREFILDTTVAEWALGWILGEVISRLLTSAVHDFIIPLVGGAFFGGVTLSEMAFQVGDCTVYYGNLILNAIDTLIVVFIVFLICELFFHMREKHGFEQEDEAAMTEDEPGAPGCDAAARSKEAELLSEIRDLLAAQQRQFDAGALPGEARREDLDTRSGGAKPGGAA